MPLSVPMLSEEAFEMLNAHCPLFRYASPECFARHMGQELKKYIYRSGETICEPTTAPEDICVGLICSGHAYVYSGDGGRKVLLRVLERGGVYGVASLFSNEPPPTRISAVGECSVIKIPRDAMRGMLYEDRSLLDAYLTFMSERVMFLNRRIACVTGGSAERRLAVYLLTLSEDAAADESGAAEITLPSGLAELSRSLDIGRASLYRALDALEALGAAERLEGRCMRVMPAKLSKMLSADE